MFSYYDMVKASTATSGAGSVTIGAAVSPFRSFSVVSDGATIRYLLVDVNGAWERGFGVYTSSTGVLTRNLECSSTGSLISLSGSATVENVLGAGDIVGASIGPGLLPAGGSVNIFALANVVPQMTSNSSAGAVASAATSYSACPPWGAFNNNRYAPGGWINDGGTSVSWLAIQLPAARTIYGYSVVGWSPDSWSGRCPKSWYLQGSNNGTDWATIDTRWDLAQGTWIQWGERFFPLSSAATYLHYRLATYANYGNPYVGVSQLILYGEIDPPANGFAGLFMKTPAGDIVMISRALSYS